MFAWKYVSGNFVDKVEQQIELAASKEISHAVRREIAEASCSCLDRLEPAILDF